MREFARANFTNSLSRSYWRAASISGVPRVTRRASMKIEMGLNDVILYFYPLHNLPCLSLLSQRQPQQLTTLKIHRRERQPLLRWWRSRLPTPMPIQIQRQSAILWEHSDQLFFFILILLVRIETKGMNDTNKYIIDLMTIKLPCRWGCLIVR